MDTQTFLTTVWPDEGLYAIATPYLPPNATKPIYRHRVFSTVAEAAAEATRLSGLIDVYFAVHTLRERRVWNPLKPDPKTGEPGAYAVRTHANMAAAKAFFFDIDVEPGHPKKYATAAEGAAALKAFCRATNLPLPRVVASGLGLHVYWVLDEAIESVTWRRIAEWLRALATKKGLLVDPARTTDVSSILRVPGTLHLKDRANPRPVVVEYPGRIWPGGEFVRAVKDACIAAGVTMSAATRHPRHDSDPLPDLGENTSKLHGDRPPPTMEAVLDACAQMRHLHDHQQQVSEPEWFQALNIVKFAAEPETWAHRMSAGHPTYSADETADKFARIRAAQTGPTSCGVLAATCGEARCADCRFQGRVKNPIMAARLVDEAPAPVAPALVSGGDAEDEPLELLPNPPRPFRRTRDSGVVMDITDKDGDKVTLTIYEHDLHPLRRVVNRHDRAEQQVWRVTLPREGHRDFAIDADALYDTRKLMVVLANNGVYPSPGNIPNLRDYMIAYIAELQKSADADHQSSHLGWSEDNSQFVLPSGAIRADGSVKTVTLSKQAERVSAHLSKAGTLQGQTAALKFFDHSAYLQNQFYIMGSLASVLFHMTGHHGVISSVQGMAGSVKSTSLYTAASFWGHPKLYPINGTNSGATARGRNERVSTLANLPVCVDEVTHMPPRDAIDLAMNVTQPGHRIRLDVTGTERASSGGYKATVMLTTANQSLHGLLATENGGGTAGSMRVFEMTFTPKSVHTKWEADEFLQALDDHHGHIGEVFVRYVVANHAKVQARVRQIMRYVDERAAIQSSERFWSALIAATVVAAGISRSLGLTSWSPEVMLEWAITTQVPAMRTTVRDEYVDPINCLLNYLADIHGATIIVDSSRHDPLANPIDKAKGPNGRSKVFVVQPPKSHALLAQYDTSTRAIWMSHRPFREYCRRTGANWREVVHELRQDDASGQSVIVGRARKVLGAFTDHGKAAVDAHIINADHPAIATTLVTKWEAAQAEARAAQGGDNVVPLRRGA